MKLVATANFKFAHRGVTVEEFQKGQKFETEDRALIDVVLNEKWAKKQGAQEAAKDDQKPQENPSPTASPVLPEIAST